MRCPRLLSLSSSCLFVILVTMMVLSQSNPVPRVNQPNWLAVAQELHPGLTPPSGSRLPQGLPPGRRRIAGFKAAAPLSGASQASGLNFAPAVPYGSGGYDAYSVVVADVNGDGKSDLVVANECNNVYGCPNGSVGVLLGNGDGTFQTAVPYDSGGSTSRSVAVGDVNGDGKPDLVVANQCVISSNCMNGLVGVLLGNGDGTFQAAVTYGSGLRPFLWPSET